MSMKDLTQCAVPDCGASISGHSNLCDQHRIPGAVVRMGDSTMVITAWAVEHGDECGTVFLNDWALGANFAGRKGFESKLREQGFANVRLLRTPQEVEAAKQSAEGKRVGDWGGPWKTQYPWEVAKAPDSSGDPSLGDARTAPTPATMVPNNDPSAPSASENSVNELLVDICKAMFNRVATVVAGTLKQSSPGDLAPISEGFMWVRVAPQQMSRMLGSGPAEADLAAAVAMFPASMRALISARVDARVQVSRSADNLVVSISRFHEPEFLFQELSEPYDVMHLLHLLCDPAKDVGHTFVMVEFSAGKFTPRGWLDFEEAARCAAEGAKNATGRPPDFRGTTGRLPK